MAIFVLLACFLIEPSSSIHQSVDAIEFNHYYDDQARLIFMQSIFWDWNGWDCRYDVVDWRILDKESIQPRRIAGGWSLYWYDDKDNCYREVYSRFFAKTYTQYDVEIYERSKLPCEMRRLLAKP